MSGTESRRRVHQFHFPLAIENEIEKKREASGGVVEHAYINTNHGKCLLRKKNQNEQQTQTNKHYTHRNTALSVAEVNWSSF